MYPFYFPGKLLWLDSYCKMAMLKLEKSFMDHSINYFHSKAQKRLEAYFLTCLEDAEFCLFKGSYLKSNYPFLPKEKNISKWISWLLLHINFSYGFTYSNWIHYLLYYKLQTIVKIQYINSNYQHSIKNEMQLEIIVILPEQWNNNHC